MVGALQREKEALQLELTGAQREIRRMSEPGMCSSGIASTGGMAGGMAGGVTGGMAGLSAQHHRLDVQQSQANLDQANLELLASAEREAALSRHVAYLSP